MSRTLTRADLTEAVYRNIGLSRNESADLVESVLEEMCAVSRLVKRSAFILWNVLRAVQARAGRP